MAIAATNFNGVSQIFTTIALRKPIHRSLLAVQSSIKKTKSNHEAPVLHEFHDSASNLSRRATIGIAISTIFHQFNSGTSLRAEEGNGLWITDLLPVPTVANPIANKETGTRSFLNDGVYMANLGVKSTAFRLKHNAFDLLTLGDLFGQDAWSHIRRYLRLKSTVMYYDFDKVISAAIDEQKQPLTDLANRLFDSVEKLEEAVKKRDDSLTQSCYDDASVILLEVMDRMTA